MFLTIFNIHTRFICYTQRKLQCPKKAYLIISLHLVATTKKEHNFASVTLKERVIHANKIGDVRFRNPKPEKPI